jgi:hypothetical protein
MYSTIGLGTASQATPRESRHKRAEVGSELTIKKLPALWLDHETTSLIYRDLLVQLFSFHIARPKQGMFPSVLITMGRFSLAARNWDSELAQRD